MSCSSQQSLTPSPLPSTLSVHFAPVPALVPVYFFDWKDKAETVFMNFCTFPFFMLAVAGAASSSLLAIQ